jgi:hypothetical protein
MIFAFVILATALMLSAVAAYYSIAGLTAIFSAAVIPVVIMGATLELGKVVATVWLHNNWKRINIAFKLYLIPAVVFLMLLTSMGIFGFLSKAHSDQSLVSGDAMSKVAIYDEKIATEKENIAQAKKAIEQMNAQVDQMLGRSDTERGAERAVSIRKNQAKERAALQAEITKSQKIIQQLQEERAPIAAEFRKVEAEVGPIKYIAALLYGDNPDQNVLERAVRWVIILIVIVFDPLALCLILAGNKQMEWARHGVGGWMHEEEKPKYEQDDGPLSPTQLDQIKTQQEIEHCPKCKTQLQDAPGIGLFCPNKECDVVDGWAEEEFFEKAKFAAQAADIIDEQERANKANEEVAKILIDENTKEEPIEEPLNEEMASDIAELNNLEDAVQTDNNSPPFEGVKNPVTGEWEQTGPSFPEEVKKPAFIRNGEYVEYQGKSMHIDVLRTSNPELFIQEDQIRASRTNFGTEFPIDARTGDTFVRVDSLPNRIFKYNGVRWIEVNRGITESHLTDQYLQFLVNKLATGEYDLDMLTDNEQLAVEKFIRNQNG